jgi:hypothetical protein
LSFRDLADAMNRIIAHPTRPIAEQTRFLLSELVTLYEADGLLSADDTVVVAARDAWPEYQRFAAYVSQPNRAFRDGLTHFGFYFVQVFDQRCGSRTSASRNVQTVMEVVLLDEGTRWIERNSTTRSTPQVGQWCEDWHCSAMTRAAGFGDVVMPRDVTKQARPRHHPG